MAAPTLARPQRMEDPVLIVVDGVVQVRLLENSGTLTGQYNGGGLVRVHRVTLGGHVIDQLLQRGSVLQGTDEVVEPKMAIAAARTNDVIDFGRFIQATTAFIGMCEQAGEDPSPEQQAEILRSYHGLLAWQTALQGSVTRAQAAMELATRRVRSVF